MFKEEAECKPCSLHIDCTCKCFVAVLFDVTDKVQFAIVFARTVTLFTFLRSERLV